MKYLLILLFSLLTVISVQAQNPPADLPAFKFTTIDGKPFTRDNLKPNTATIFFYFDPGCDHCQNQSKLIFADIAKFKDVQFVFITMEEDVAKIKEFQAKYFPGVTNPTLTFTQDPMLNIDSYFGRCEVPTIMVYDKNRKFKKSFKKEGSGDFKEFPAAVIAGSLQ